MLAQVNRQHRQAPRSAQNDGAMALRYARRRSRAACATWQQKGLDHPGRRARPGTLQLLGGHLAGHSMLGHVGGLAAVGWSPFDDIQERLDLQPLLDTRGLFGPPP